MIYAFADYELDTDRCELRRGGRTVHVEPQVFDLLVELVRSRDRVVTRDEMLERVWGHRFVTDATLASRVKAARRAIGDSGAEQRFIRTLRGRGLRFVGEVDERSPAPSAPAPAVPGLVGRDAELAVLRGALGDALAGDRRVVVVTGEIGAGKTTLVDALRREAAAVPGLRWAQGQCIPQSGAGEPHLPVLEALAQLCRGEGGDEVVAALRRIAPMWLVRFPWLLDAPDDDLGARLLGATPERMLREMAEALEAVSASAPLVLAIEDAQWSDPSTLDLLHAVALRGARARLLVLVTVRVPDADGPEALRALLREGRAERRREVRLAPLTRHDVAELLVARSVEPGVAEVLAGPLHARTDGNPLFVNSVIEDWRARGPLAPQDGRLVLEPGPDVIGSAVPDDLRDLVEHQLAQLTAAQRDLLEAGSVVGTAFSAALAAAGLEEDAEAVERRAAEMARAGRWLRAEGAEPWPDGTLTERFAFVHHLHREVLYGRMPAGRRARLHARVGTRLAQAHAADPGGLAPTLATHFLNANDEAAALPWLRSAAEGAAAANGFREALRHARSALEILARRPDLPDAPTHELALQSLLGPLVVATDGWRAPEAERAYVRARELCAVLGERDRLSGVLYGLATLHEYRGEYPASQALIERRLELVPDADGAGLVASHELLACSLFHQGEFSRSLVHADEGVRAHRGADRHPAASALGEHPAVNCHGWAALSLCFLGRSDEALERARAGISLARDPARRFSLANALVSLARLHQQRGEPDAALAAATEGESLAAEWGFAYVGAAACAVRGWAEVGLGRHEQGLVRLRAGLERHDATGARMDRPYFLGLHADACLTAGRAEEAADAVGRALALLAPRRPFFYTDVLRALDARVRETGLTPRA